MAVAISGMFGSAHTYFDGSPVIITVSGLQWPAKSPFKIVRLDVIRDGAVVGEFHGDTGGQSEISFDISSALRDIWSGYDFAGEVAIADSGGGTAPLRAYRSYSLMVYTEYMSSDDGGVFTQTGFGPFDGGRCAVGAMTGRERAEVTDTTQADLSWFEATNLRNGDASTKPRETPERVGSSSMTSWTDISNRGTQTLFFQWDDPCQGDSRDPHAPIVLRDTMEYTDFLFVNRRGAVETCSAPVKEAMSFEAERKLYSRVGRPSFIPGRTVTAVGGTPRRSWKMSSGHQTREWADWWAAEFLASRHHWMLCEYREKDSGGNWSTVRKYVPVIVEPAKKSQTVYDRSKQQYQSVEFTVTLALEG